MTRQRYLIAYDIREPARLRRVIKVMESFGDRLQYSVFLCDLTGMETIRWREKITEVVDLKHDSIVKIDLGPPGSRSIEMLGAPARLPRTGPTVV